MPIATYADPSTQGEGVSIATQWLSMLPYLATIVVLVLELARRELHQDQRARVTWGAFVPTN